MDGEAGSCNDTPKPALTPTVAESLPVGVSQEQRRMSSDECSSAWDGRANLGCESGCSFTTDVVVVVGVFAAVTASALPAALLHGVVHSGMRGMLLPTAHTTDQLSTRRPDDRSTRYQREPSLKLTQGQGRSHTDTGQNSAHGQVSQYQHCCGWPGLLPFPLHPPPSLLLLLSLVFLLVPVVCGPNLTCLTAVT